MIKKNIKKIKKSNRNKKGAVLITVTFSVLILTLSFLFIPLQLNTLQNNTESLPPNPPPVPPPIPPPIYDITYYEELGSFTTLENTAFEGENSIYYPIELGQDGLKHPLIIWGDGTFTFPSIYNGLLRHLASHGFVVIGPNDMSTGNGDTMIAAMDLLILKNDDPSSQFYQKLDVDHICVMGHSQGGGTTLILGENEKITCTVPIQPWVEIYGDISSINQNGPMLLITGTEDVICPPGSNSDLVFLNSNVPTIYGNLIGADHFTPVGDAGAMKKYITAWCYAHLFDNIGAQSIFYGSDALIYDDTQWIWDTTNIKF